jgi:hypothetical protein
MHLRSLSYLNTAVASLPTSTSSVEVLRLYLGQRSTGPLKGNLEAKCLLSSWRYNEDNRTS